MRSFYVYILGSRSGVLYIGITSDLERRTYEHQHGVVDGFTQRYEVKRLLYFEEFSDPLSAIAREKQLKRWNRSKKLTLIRSLNPMFKDLSKAWENETSVQTPEISGCAPKTGRDPSTPAASGRDDGKES
ncbi:MAG: GIY-YIG nuclease family protein [Deltaproteobacteria bacterium]|nr:GIY-YIG nuclease family protein [Deltaproteobacteria bacterium]